MVEAKYKVYHQYNHFQWNAWLEEDGRRLSGYSRDGFAMHPPFLQQAGAIRQAKRACRRILREHRKNGSPTITGTVTQNGKPSYNALEERITELEYELGIE
jgi:hypothetical protein